MSLEDDLLIFFVNLYNEKKIKIIPCGVVAEYAILKKYNQFIREGLLTPIENLSHEEKIKLFNMVKEKNKPKTKQEIISTCKILSVINLINEQ